MGFQKTGSFKKVQYLQGCSKTLYFFPGFTQGNEDAGQSKVSLCCFGVIQENEKAGDSEIPLRKPSNGKLLFRFSSTSNK